MSQTNAPSPSGVPAWTVADRLRKARETIGLTQSEMAAELEIGRTTVVGYEAGKTSPGRPVLVTWAMRTGVPFEWLRDGTTPEDGGPNGGSGLGVRPTGCNADVIDIASRWPLASAA